MKTRIRIETSYSEVLDLTINVEQDIVDILVNDVLTTLADATETKSSEEPNQDSEE